MHATFSISAILSLALAAAAQNVTTALYDGTCYYPTADPTFDISTYLGTWYQVAGTIAIFDVGCKCITAEYTLNDDGSVGVVNSCQELGIPINITGTAVAADAAYGDVGVLEVTLAGIAPTCPGPNYIVQEYVEGDYAIVQAPEFSTLFILSREQNRTTADIDSLMARAEELGSNLALVVVNDQSC